MTETPPFPPNLPELVTEKFETARSAGDLTFWRTEVSIRHISGVPFQLRFCPGLANKPKSGDSSSGKAKIDPFLNPSNQLLIAELMSSHILVLNKFAIIPKHFILATKDFKEQTDLLEEDDLWMAYRCLQAWGANGEELFGFFNSGEHSGASQPHRHIQFLPVDSMKDGLSDGDWQPLINDLSTATPPDLPFTYFASSLPSSPTPAQLYKIYVALFERACSAAEAYDISNPEFRSTLLNAKERQARISYNLAITKKGMAICPRRAEGMKLPISESRDTGIVALNGTVLAGTLLVKSDMEWESLKTNDSLLEAVLESIGIPVSPGPKGDDSKQRQRRWKSSA